MICKIRKWKLSDAKDLAMALYNRKIQDNLRDGLPYPCTEQDGLDYISSMISAAATLARIYIPTLSLVMETAQLNPNQLGWSLMFAAAVPIVSGLVMLVFRGKGE